MMKVFITLLTALSVIHQAEAATGCTRDACYSAVAFSTRGQNPPLASRRADCSSILRTVIDDDKTVTSTTYQTVFPQTTTISNVGFTVTETDTSTITSTSTKTVEETFTSTSLELAFTTLYSSQVERLLKRLARATARPAGAEQDTFELDPRDIIIGKGNRPPYASAACRNVQSYVTACLCFGVKAPVYTDVTKTKIVTSTRSAVASVTVLISTTEDVTFTSRITSFSTQYETSTTTTTTTTSTVNCQAQRKARDLGMSMATGISNLYYGAMETRPAQND